MLLCKDDCKALLQTPLTCESSTTQRPSTSKPKLPSTPSTTTLTTTTRTTTTSTTMTTEKRACTCFSADFGQMTEGSTRIKSFGPRCRQKITCPVNCGYAIKSVMECDVVSTTLAPIVSTISTIPSTVIPFKAKCTWGGRMFNDLIQTGPCTWLKCIPHMNRNRFHLLIHMWHCYDSGAGQIIEIYLEIVISYAPKLIQSCTRPDSILLPPTTTEAVITTTRVTSTEATKMAMWAPWEVHLFTGQSMGPENPNKQDTRTFIRTKIDSQPKQPAYNFQPRPSYNPPTYTRPTYVPTTTKPTTRPRPFNPNFLNTSWRQNLFGSTQTAGANQVRVQTNQSETKSTNSNCSFWRSCFYTNIHCKLNYQTKC